MKKLLCLIALTAVFTTGCTTAKLDTNGQPPPGYRVVPVVPPAF